MISGIVKQDQSETNLLPGEGLNLLDGRNESELFKDSVGCLFQVQGVEVEVCVSEV